MILHGEYLKSCEICWVYDILVTVNLKIDMKSSSAFISLVALSIGFGVSASVYANTPTTRTPVTSEQQQRATEIRSNAQNQVNSEEFQQRAKVRCQAIATKLEAHGSTYETRFAKRSESYQKIVTRLQDLDTKLQSEGRDTTELKVLIADLQKVITAYQSEVRVYLASVEDVSSEVCGSGDIRTLLTDLRADLKEVVMNSEEVKKFVATKVIPYLNSL